MRTAAGGGGKLEFMSGYLTCNSLYCQRHILPLSNSSPLDLLGFWVISHSLSH